MTIINKSALLRYPAHLMYALVDDVLSYPEFLPWCSASRIIQRSQNTMDAELKVEKSGFNQCFSTRNTLIEPHEIRIELIEGPFSNLKGVWHFTPLREDACKISLELEFEMSSTLSNLAFGAFFNQACTTMITAFSNRAKVLYSNP